MTALKTITLLTSQEVVAEGVGEAVEIGNDRFFAVFTVELSLLDPDATVRVAIQTSELGSGWAEVAYLEPLEAEGSYVLKAIGCKKKVRVAWVPDGGGATLEVTGISHQTYCTNDDVDTFSLPSETLAAVPAVTRAEGCVAATDEAASYLSEPFDLPLVKWGVALRMHTSNMAAYHAMKRRGYDAENDPTVRLGYTDAIAWLKGYAAQDASIEDSSPTIPADAGYVVSEAPRGWQR